MLFENRMDEFESEICAILAHLAHHIHPQIVKYIQIRNAEEYSYFSKLFEGQIELRHYLFNGSACVFPGVRRYIGGRGKRKAYNAEYYRAIVDDNTFPRHIWCFLENGRIYNGPNWRSTGLNQFELAHIFTHKETELDFEKYFFTKIDKDLAPYGEFSCAANVILLPKGTVRPTDNSTAIKAVFYKRYIDLYGEAPLGGRVGFIDQSVPVWFQELKWNEPVLPNDWQGKIEELLEYRTKRITKLLKEN